MNPSNILCTLFILVSGQLAPLRQSNQPLDYKIQSYRCTVLSGIEGLKLANQCSRSGVVGAISTWNPSASEIAVLETKLSTFLRITQPKTYARLSKCYFQFVGYNLKGRRIIYVNSFDESMVQEPMSDPKKTWRNTGVSVCDGGPSFWGVEFDPLTGFFSNIDFNGAA